MRTGTGNFALKCILQMTQLCINIPNYCLSSLVHSAQVNQMASGLSLSVVSHFNKPSFPVVIEKKKNRYLELLSATVAPSTSVCLFGEYSSPSTTWKYVSIVGSCLEKGNRKRPLKRERSQEGRWRRGGRSVVLERKGKKNKERGAVMTAGDFDNLLDIV